MHVTGSTNYIEIPTGEGANIEDYYRKMVEANSSNPLFLKNYAQFLHQVKSKCPLCKFDSQLKLHRNTISGAAAPIILALVEITDILYASCY